MRFEIWGEWADACVCVCEPGSGASSALPIRQRARACASTRARARAKTHEINCVPHARPLPGHTPAYPHLQDLQINEQLTKNAEEIGAAYRSNDSSWGIWVTEAKNRLIKIAAASRLYLLGSKCSLASQALSPSRLLARFGVPLPRPPPRPPLEPRPAEPPRCPPRPAPPVYKVTVRFMHTKASVNSK